MRAFHYAYNYFMLRISNLLRSRSLHRAIARGGGGGWDRPDVPPTATVPLQHQLSEVQMCWFFQDDVMPEALISNNEVFIGDNAGQYAPVFLGYIGGTFAAIAAFGLFLYILQPSYPLEAPTAQIMQIYEAKKARLQNKTIYNQALDNPIGISLSPESFPREAVGFMSMTPFLQQQNKNNEYCNKVTKEVSNYLRGVRDRAAQKVAKGDSHQQSHATHH